MMFPAVLIRKTTRWWCEMCCCLSDNNTSHQAWRSITYIESCLSNFNYFTDMTVWSGSSFWEILLRLGSDCQKPQLLFCYFYTIIGAGKPHYTKGQAAKWTLTVIYLVLDKSDNFLADQRFINIPPFTPVNYADSHVVLFVYEAAQADKSSMNFWTYECGDICVCNCTVCMES